MSEGDHLVRIDGRRLRLTNLDKIMYPATATTKGEVIDYYTRIAPALIPHLAGRPVTRKRWVEGVGARDRPEPVFFAKDLEQGAPGWVPRQTIDHATGAKHYPLVGDIPTLVYLAQVASLELHVPQWRFDARGGRANPDRLVLDLDPGPGVGLAECAEVARWAREVLEDMGVHPYPVTSGSKGIHLYAALDGTLTSDDATALARELARALEADHPDLVVSQMAKAARPGKVLLDWSQNNGAKTTIAPFSLRGREHPTVAAPRTWEELDDPDLRHLLFDEVLDRAASSGDPMAALGFSARGRADADGPLSPYIAKRTAGRTPEPVPENALAHPARSDAPTFVVQEHHASRLHWDFRLEHDGVLVSWAVPKGVPRSSAHDALAVMTEDHPLEYASFEGSIPRGEYGAGTVTVWDEGTYDLEKWRVDEIIVTVHGRPGGPLGSVRLALIRTDGEGEKSTWLLHRMKTDAAGRAQPDAAQPSARALAPASAPARSSTPAPGPMLATHATAGLATSAAARWGETAWVEVKWDGIRAMAVWDGNRVRLRGRAGTDITDRYPELTAVDARLTATDAVLDGELVALDDTGRPSFSLLQARMNLTSPAEIAREARRTPVRFYVFDALAADGRDLSSLPLRERRTVMEAIVRGAIDDIVAPPVFDDIDRTLADVRRFALEGIVVKNPAAPYRAGRSEHWLKVKLTRTQDVVIGGIRVGDTRERAIKSLLLGIPGAHGLDYVGRVGSGFSDRALARLAKTLTPLLSDTSPFVDVPAADAADAAWVRPEVVGEVEFAEFTPGGILRHARWRGIRSDKSPDDVALEP